jgi:hypothetical protein
VFNRQQCQAINRVTCQAHSRLCSLVLFLPGSRPQLHLSNQRRSQVCSPVSNHLRNLRAFLANSQ